MLANISYNAFKMYLKFSFLAPKLSCNQYIIIEFSAYEVTVSVCYAGNGIESGDLSCHSCDNH